MAYFRITLLRSAIGLPRKSLGVLKALGLRKRMAVVYHPVTQSVAGQIMRVKELVDVLETPEALTKTEIRASRKPDPGFYVEKRGWEERGDAGVKDRWATQWGEGKMMVRETSEEGERRRVGGERVE